MLLKPAESPPFLPGCLLLSLRAQLSIPFLRSLIALGAAPSRPFLLAEGMNRPLRWP